MKASVECFWFDRRSVDIVSVDVDLYCVDVGCCESGK